MFSPKRRFDRHYKYLWILKLCQEKYQLGDFCTSTKGRNGIISTVSKDIVFNLRAKEVFLEAAVTQE